MSIDLRHPDRFQNRHIGPQADEQAAMLATIGRPSLDDLIDATIPSSIRLDRDLELAPGRGEREMLSVLKAQMDQNAVWRSYIGMGYYGTHTPPVIQRNILENPGWYTQYTPYQAEISQGRLEALLNYQTMVADLCGMEIANASLLDEATAAAEAMSMALAAVKRGQTRRKFLVSTACHPQTIALIHTRAEPLGVEIVVGEHADFDFDAEDVFGCLLQYPASDGRIERLRPRFVSTAHAAGASGDRGRLGSAGSLALLTAAGRIRCGRGGGQ